MKKYKILITGCAGFIGFHLSKKICSSKFFDIVGIDNLNNYYDIQLKVDRLSLLHSFRNFKFHKIDIKNRSELNPLFNKYNFDLVINLAAQAGVRYSFQNPFSYIDNNVTGFLNILEEVKSHNIKNVLYASSSSVYGNNKKIPFSESDSVDYPISIYAATKKTDELIAYTYHSQLNINLIGLRFFTVYGEWGRPDMAYFVFTKNILDDKPISLFNNGNMKRDFTYVGDIVKGIEGIIKKLFFTGNHFERPIYEIFNIGNNTSVELKHFINIIEYELKKKAKINYLPMQNGDVYETYADIEKLKSFIGYDPQTPIEIGLPKFINWYKKYYYSQYKTIENSLKAKATV
jgi:UDP-glucuronate 4-epimerase